MNSGANVYGDRDITIVSAPTELANAEAIRTACDSKMYTEQLASFTAGEDIAVYAAVDTRVSGRLDWLKNWTDTGAAVTTSNDVTLELFRTEAKSGTQVALGTNGDVITARDALSIQMLDANVLASLPESYSP